MAGMGEEDEGPARAAAGTAAGGSPGGGGGLAYDALEFGGVQLHRLHTGQGRVFVMSQVAANLFEESPTVLAKDLRAGRYPKHHSTKHDVAAAVEELELPQESFGGDVGVTLLSKETVEALMVDRRRGDLVQPFQLALLKAASQEASMLTAEGDYERALPVALEAVKQGQVVFKESHTMQLFPIYLLAAQANLGLRQAKNCEDFLGLSSWLALKEPDMTTHLMRSQLSRLFGQLYILQGKHDNAVQAFAEDVYYCSLEYGPQDLRTSLGYYNLAKVFESQKDLDKCLACHEQVIHIWGSAFRLLVLDVPSNIPGMKAEMPLSQGQLREVADMLMDICTSISEMQGEIQFILGDAHFVTGLALAYIGENEAAKEQMELAKSRYPEGETEVITEVDDAIEKILM